MTRKQQEPGPHEDGEEQCFSPSSLPGPGAQAGQVRPPAAGMFVQGGAGDVMAPGGELAGLVAAAVDADGSALGVLADQEVLGVLGGVQRLAAWAAWGELVVLAEFARRRPGFVTGAAGARAMAEEAAWVSGESWTRMLDQAARGQELAERLPLCLDAMRAGRLSGYKVMIIAEQVSELSAADAAEADRVLSRDGQDRAPGALRDRARRLVARLDPEAAGRRKAKARARAYVHGFPEASGNMGIAIRQAGVADGTVAMQNIERRAQYLHATGEEGSHGSLQVQAAMDFLLGRVTPASTQNTDAREQDARSDAREEQSARSDARKEDAWEEDAWEEDGLWDEPADQDEDESACCGAHGDKLGQAGSEGVGKRRSGGRGSWMANPVLIVPWDPSLGGPSGPADLPGYGLVDQDDTIDLLEAAGKDRASRWCLTVTGPDGTAVAHGCAAGPRTLEQVLAASTGTAAGLAQALKVTLIPVARGTCDHRQQEPQYRPSRKLRHLVKARNATCTAPGCSHPATACDQDHTIAYGASGGITCECNLAPRCRRHHMIKQSPGWQLSQPAPGILTWTSPAGLTRTTRPTVYQQ